MRSSCCSSLKSRSPLYILVFFSLSRPQASVAAAGRAYHLRSSCAGPAFETLRFFSLSSFRPRFTLDITCAPNEAFPKLCLWLTTRRALNTVHGYYGTSSRSAVAQYWRMSHTYAYHDRVPVVCRTRTKPASGLAKPAKPRNPWLMNTDSQNQSRYHNNEIP